MSSLNRILLLALLVATLFVPSGYAQTKAKKPAAPATNAQLDINTASRADLVALPAIGEAYAQKIIDGRPYKRKDELVSRHIVPADTYAKIKDKIIASQPPKK